MTYKCLSIAGFDGSGGAGIQADLKTFAATGVYGMNVLTAIPVQNTRGVISCYAIPSKCILEQLKAIFSDIKPHAIKIGMLFSKEIINIVANFLQKYAVNTPIVVDPIIKSSSGNILLQNNALSTLIEKIIPLANIITPNLPEAYQLIGKKYPHEILAKKLLSLGCNAVLLKGGHDNTIMANDFFISHTQKKILSAIRINTKNTHGTGCTLSAAITSFLAQNYNYLEACIKAKKYLYNAILNAQKQEIGNGTGPVNHFFIIPGNKL